jgi:hypothetical protein
MLMMFEYIEKQMQCATLSSTQVSIQLLCYISLLANLGSRVGINHLTKRCSDYMSLITITTSNHSEGPARSDLQKTVPYERNRVHWVSSIMQYFVR